MRWVKKLLLSSLVFAIPAPIGWPGVSMGGVSDRIEVANGRHTGGESEVTVSMWVKPTTWVSTDCLFEDGADGGYWQNAIYEGTWYTRDSSTGSQGARNNDLALPAVSTGVWTHLCFVYSVAGGYKRVYVNGVQEAEHTTSIDALTTQGTNCYIGRPVSGTYFDGEMTDVALWHSALSLQEIELLAKSKAKRMPLQIDAADLVFYLPMDDGVAGTSANGETANDLAGSTNDGTAAGCTWAGEPLTYP